MYEQFYRIEVNAICLFFLVWIILRIKIFQDNQTRNILFIRAIIGALILIVLDTIMNFVSGDARPAFYVFNWIFNTGYCVLNAYTAYAWFSYVIYTLLSDKKRVAAINKLTAVPLVIFITLAITSVFTKLIFYIQPATNTFVDGKLSFLQIIVAYGFFTSASFISLIFFIRKKHTIYKTYVIILSFIVLPFLGGFFHIVFPKARIVWQMLVIAFLLIYIEIQFDLISRDSLTGLNNRGAFDKYLKRISEEEPLDFNSRRPFIFMIDVNLFKEINDTFGHTEGDNALIVTGKIILNCFRNTNAHVSRYGGDEFAIIYPCTEEEASNIRKELYKNFELSSENYNLEYKLTVSIGYAAIKERSLEAGKEALKLADKNLYVEKDFMHKKQK